MNSGMAYTLNSSKGGTQMNNQTVRDAMIQNLKDAGCEDDFIKGFVFMIENNRNKEAFSQLRGWRNSLLDEIHDNQHKLDRLDYLIRKLGG